MKTTTTLLACLGLLLATSPANAARFYKWTDESGATHYSAEPPPSSVKSDEIRIKSSPGEAASEPAKNTAAPTASKDSKAASGKSEEKKADEGASANRYAEQCEKLKANLKALQENARVRTTDAKGENRVLTDEEKADQLDYTQRQIKALCE